MSTPQRWAAGLACLRQLDHAGGATAVRSGPARTRCDHPAPRDLDEKAGAHIARWDPEAVLRLVAAHRKVIAEYRLAADRSEQLLGADPLSSLTAYARMRGLQVAVQTLARGYGIEEEPDA